MNKFHKIFISVIKDQKYLIFWGEATKRYSQLLDKYHTDFLTVNPKNFSFESSLTKEFFYGMEKFGLLKKSKKE